MKRILKKILVAILGNQVRRLRRRHDFKIIGVVGSIGKTSTKLAIAKVLKSEKRVRYQEGNYNDIVSVSLVIFGHEMPSLWNIFSWLKIILQNEAQIYGKFPFDFVVVELGTDKPGQISEFRKYIHLDIAIITAIAPEHMEFFETLENVAEEEWSVRYYSDYIFVNRDLCQVLPEDLNRNKVEFYGKNSAEELGLPDMPLAQRYSLNAAASVAKYLKLSDEKIREEVKGVKAFPGRMQRLRGIKNSTIIDDTYNASPVAVKMAINALYSYEAPQRIAILGMMNELGEISEEEHGKIGKQCNPKFLDLVVTIGKDANSYLAPAARQNGCEVYEFQSSTEAGLFVKDKIKEGAVILAKGSQNGVFAEEALKPLLADKSDFSKLVRQDEEWMKKKGLI